jgi:hypothetical protein
LIARDRAENTIRHVRRGLRSDTTISFHLPESDKPEVTSKPSQARKFQHLPSRKGSARFATRFAAPRLSALARAHFRRTRPRTRTCTRVQV